MSESITVCIGVLVAVSGIGISEWLKARRPSAPQASAPPAETPGMRPAHCAHIFVVKRLEPGSEKRERIRELTGGMSNHANHADVGAALNCGPDIGIEWNDGKVEWGTLTRQP